MNTITHTTLVRFLRKKNIKNVLEFGSGLKSTKVIRRVLSKKNDGGFCLSLENTKKWYKKVVSKIPDDEFGKVVLSPMVMNDNGYVYDYVFNKKFDLVLIDGPDMTITDDQRNMFNLFLDSKKSCINGVFRDGIQSMHLLESILPFCHKDTVIIVDGRICSVIYYYYRDKDKVNIKFISTNKNKKRMNERYIKILPNIKTKYIMLLKKICLRCSKVAVITLK